MVGIVIVSHSRALAEALVGLVRQVSITPVPIAVAAGVGDDRREFGTDAVEISEAIQAVYSEQGVMVLMDLGSAVLSAEMAVDLLPPEMAANIRFCPGPLVEGAIAAGVQAGLGSDLDMVYQEASQALLPKAQHLAETVPSAEITGVEPVEMAAQQEVVLTLRNLHGLHARPAARFVQTAASFDAAVQVKNLTRGRGPVSAKSLNALATLGAVFSDQIAVVASGAQAEEALAALQKLVADNFGEPEVSSPEKFETGMIVGKEIEKQVVAVSEGYALGPFYRYQPAQPEIPQEEGQDLQAEWARLERALETTRLAIQKRRQQLGPQLGEAQVAIFDAHALILQDPDLLQAVRRFIFDGRQNAAAAWHKGIAQVAKVYQDLPDPYMRQRAIDVLDVGNQVLFALMGKGAAAAITFSEPVILFAQELTPTETAQLDMSQVLGILTVGGGPTSHSAILARAMGIPAVAGVDPSLDITLAGTMIALDGFSGKVIIRPTEEEMGRLKAQRETWLEQRAQLLKVSQQPAVTRDGRRVEVVANVGQVKDAALAVKNGAEGIGLLRTEFLFLTRDTPPTEEEQYTALRQVVEQLGHLPVVVRTLDIGGDKEVPYLEMPHEANPFLGVRAIRLGFQKPELLRTQLRAILRAGYGADVRVMFPMVASAEEIALLHQFMEEAHRSLEGENLLHLWPLQTGIMVEIPGAAVMSKILARQVDFFSIGTNDLTQYTLAAERGNPVLSGLADALHPAVLNLINLVVASAHAEGKWVGVCGELAGDALAVPVLVGLGIDELSMNPAAVPKVKAIVRELNLPEAQVLAKQVLEVENAAAARSLVKKFAGERLKNLL